MTEVEHFKQRKYFVIQGDCVIERCVLEGSTVVEMSVLGNIRLF